jgi:caffeoyl-CoA O-methyltransferase
LPLRVRRLLQAHLVMEESKGMAMDVVRRRTVLAALGFGLSFPGAASAERGNRGRAVISECGVMEVAPLARNEMERAALGVLDEIDKKMAFFNVHPSDGRLLRVLAESMNAKSIVEIGTSTGYSAICMAMGVKSTGGRLLTYEIDRGRAAIAAANFKRAGLDDTITIVIGDAHEELTKLKGALDLVFIDAEKEGYPDYLRQTLPLVRPGGLIVADNMRRPEPDPRYVTAVTTDPSLETLFLNMHGTGLAVTLKKG